MSHSELAIAGFYDHEQETTRRAPDWGGDDLFAGPAPRRRRFERAQYPARLRESAHDHIAPPAPVHPEPRLPEPSRAALDMLDLAGPEAREPERYMEPVPEGRRTVTITGHPGGVATPRRPPRTLDERIAHRPERIASWTCAMGFLSIALAIITSH
jgi:hypothetical protein